MISLIFRTLELRELLGIRKAISAHNQKPNAHIKTLLRMEKDYIVRVRNQNRYKMGE